MNLKDNNVKFTFETENSKNFSCLDIKVTRKNKRFVISIFHKATYTKLQQACET